MTTITRWQVDDLQQALYRLLIQDRKALQSPADHSEGRGYFETALVVDPFGSVFKMISSKEDTKAIMKDNKTL
ncbi:hypothetical protein [Niabella drilacis]|nr:hypothetical protein [Niabella drilacis]